MLNWFTSVLALAVCIFGILVCRVVRYQMCIQPVEFPQEISFWWISQSKIWWIVQFVNLSSLCFWIDVCYPWCWHVWGEKLICGMTMLKVSHEQRNSGVPALVIFKKSISSLWQIRELAHFVSFYLSELLYKSRTIKNKIDRNLQWGNLGILLHNLGSCIDLEMRWATVHKALTGKEIQYSVIT